MVASSPAISCTPSLARQLEIGSIVGVLRRFIIISCIVPSAKEQTLSYPVKAPVAALVPIGYSTGHFRSAVPWVVRHHRIELPVPCQCTVK